jgi:hypothetical protein
MDATNIRSSMAAAVGGRDRLARNYSARTFSDLHKRADREIDEVTAFALEGGEAIEKIAKRLGLEDPALLEELKGEHVARLRGAWASYQAAGARVLNWMITGPARFPVERNRKRMETEHNRMTEYLAIAKGAAAWAEKRIKRRIREELGPVGVAAAELDQARRKLADREKRQAFMKAANPIVRRHRGKITAGGNRSAAMEAVAADLKAAGFPCSSALASSLLMESYGGRIPGFEPWQLSNNNAEIHRLRGRVAELEARAAAVAAAADVEPCNTAPIGDQVRILENVLEQRVQILFPGKPSAEIRARLKGRGFRWAPSQGAWQRQLTPQAVDVARAIVAAANQENAECA